MLYCSCRCGFSTYPALLDHKKSTGHCYCQQCDKAFIHEEALQQHKATIQPWNCDTCGETFCYEKKRRSHQLSSQHCYCKICNLIFRTEASLMQHSAALHSNPCGVCGKAFRFPKALEQHQITNEHCYCKPCNLVFPTKEDFQQHCTVFHPLTCGICLRKFAKIDALRDHERSTSHALCQECGRYFISRAALNQHIESFHRSNFHCCDCNRDFVDELALSQHLHTKSHPGDSQPKTATYPCSKCKRTFKSKGALDMHLTSLAHKPLSDIKCVASTQCNGQFSAPSALVQHLESGTCCSGLNRKKLNLLVQSNDVDRVITDGTGKKDLLLSAEQYSDSDSDSDSDFCNGVPIYTPVSSQTASPMLLPNVDGTFSALLSQNISNESLFPGILTPRSSLDLSELSSAPVIIGLFCPLCPPTRKAFHNTKALEMHLASPKHAPKLFHCPSNLLGPTKAGGNHGAVPARFSTLSGLTQHVESGACKGGQATLKAAIKVLEERLKDMGLQNPSLLKA